MCIFHFLISNLKLRLFFIILILFGNSLDFYSPMNLYKTFEPVRLGLNNIRLGTIIHISSDNKAIIGTIISRSLVQLPSIQSCLNNIRTIVL